MFLSTSQDVAEQIWWVAKLLTGSYIFLNNRIAHTYRKYLFIKKLKSVQKCYIILLGGETGECIYTIQK